MTINVRKILASFLQLKCCHFSNIVSRQKLFQHTVKYGADPYIFKHGHQKCVKILTAADGAVNNTNTLGQL